METVAIIIVLVVVVVIGFVGRYIFNSISDKAINSVENAMARRKNAKKPAVEEKLSDLHSNQK